MATGDISLQTRKGKHPFENLKELLECKDILFGNLETVLSNQGGKARKAVLLNSPPESVKYLKDAGFDILNIANNHISDMGIEGFNKTLDILRENGLNFIGAGNNGKSISPPLILERNGLKLGFLGYTLKSIMTPECIPTNPLKERGIITDIESIKDKCDFIIVSLHWGTENVFYPSPKQIDLAHKLVDNGATLILGHHPHVVQGIEKYRRGLIAYSLGNFQFDPALSQSKTNRSMIICVTFNKDGIKDYSILPVLINEDFLPSVIEGDEKDKFLRFLAEISKPIKNGEIKNGWWFNKIAREYLTSNMNSYKTRIKRYGIGHLLECILWLISPFCLRCYLAIMTRWLRRAKRY